MTRSTALTLAAAVTFGLSAVAGRVTAAQTSVLAPTPEGIVADYYGPPADDLPAVEFSPEVFAPFDAEGGDAVCSSCNGGTAGGYFNRCGCNTALFPWIRGPGQCDQWCVGPHWQISLNGLIWQRDENDWSAFGLGGVNTFTDTFDFAPGARLLVTAYNDAGYGLQVGYEGVNDFTASISAALPGADLVSTLDDRTRTIAYESNINSLEVNFIPQTDTVWKWIGGVRYIELDEDVLDSDSLTDPTAIIPAPATPPDTAFYTDATSARLLDNRLIGFQIGAFRDAWNFNRWLSLEAFANTGVYLNNLSYRTAQTSVTTVYNGDDLSTPANDFLETSSTVRTGTKRRITEAAFSGEAGVAAVLRLNRCFALRGGYQVLYIDGVGLAANDYPGVEFNGDSLLYHGLQFGAEYRR